MTIPRDQDSDFTEALNAVYDMDYGVNVFAKDKSTSITLYKSAASELFFLPFPYWEEGLAGSDAT